MPEQRNETGFTLLELLAVLIIMSLMIGLLPRLGAGLERVRLRRAADGLVTHLEQYRETAVERGQTVDVVFDRVRRRYGALGGKIWPIEGGVETVSLGPIPGGPPCPDDIRFFPDGGASGCLIRLSAGHVSETVSVDWLTGRVRYHE